MFNFLFHRLAGPIAAGLLAVSLIGNATLGVSLWAEKRHSGKLADRIVALGGELATCRLNNARLEGAVSKQNAAVDGIKTAADLAAASAKLGQAAAEVTAAAHDANAKALGKLPPLPAGADRCAAASALIKNTVAGERTK